MRVRCVVTVDLDLQETRLPDGRIELRCMQLPHLHDAARTKRTAEKYLRHHVRAWARWMLAIQPADGRAAGVPPA